MTTRRLFLKEMSIGAIGATLFPYIPKFFNHRNLLKEPTNLQIKTTSASHFTITWRDNSDDEQGFRIERKKDGEWEVVGITDADNTHFLSTGCYANTSYDHRVIAFKDSTKAASKPVSGTTSDKLKQRRNHIIENSSVRQGEGTFLKLKNGDLELYYSDMETTSDLAEAQVSKKISKDGGNTWSEKQIVFMDKGFALFLPGILRLPNGNVGITYARRIPGEWFSIRVFRYSEDEGKKWSDEIQVSDDTYNYSTGSHDRIYRLSNDNIIILVHSVSGEGKSRPRNLVTDVYRTSDNGLTWKKMSSNSLNVPENPFEKGEYGFWEASIAELENGKIVMFGRTATSWLYHSESLDYGESWTQPQKMGIPQPLSPPYIKKIPNSDLILLLNNPVVEKEHRLLGNRYVLASQISNDGGKTWKNYKQIEYHSHDWWYDYPNILFDENDVHLSMRDIELTPKNRWKNVNLGYLKLPKEWFQQ